MKKERQFGDLAQSITPRRRITRNRQTARRFAGKARLVSTLMLCVFVALIGPNRADAQSKSPFYIFDDFEDGSFKDGSPASWTVNSGPGGNHLAKIIDGDLIRDLEIPEHGIVGYMEHRHLVSTNVSIRTQARMLEELGDPMPEPSHAISLIARLRGDLGNHFFHEPEAYTFIDLWSNGEVRTQQTATAEPRMAHTNLRPLEEDVVLQLDTFGENIEFRVWPAGEPRPEEPIIQYTAEDDPTVLPGGVGFGTFFSKAAFRYVLVADTPIEDLAGDFNFDFQLTASDIDMLTAETSFPTPRSWFDVNGDDVVTQADREFWVESEDLAHTFFGDADLNGEVDFADFLALLKNFDQDGGWAQGDFDGSGKVEFADFVLLSGNFGNERVALAQSVPEPNTSVLIVLSCCLCLLRRPCKRTSFYVSEA